MSDASSVGVAGASGIDMGSSTSIVAVDEPALLGMLKEGPQGLGLAAGESAKADAVLDAEAGVRVLFQSSICLNRASRSGNIFLGIVIVFLAALSYNKTMRCQTGGAADSDPQKPTVAKEQEKRYGEGVPQRQHREDAV